MRRWLAVFVLLLPLGDAAAVAAQAFAHRHHSCDDHACSCARRCPAKRAASDECHGSSRPATSVRGACSHDRASLVAPAAVAVLPSVPSGMTRLGLELLPDPRRTAIPPGFARLDLPPPRPC